MTQPTTETPKIPDPSEPVIRRRHFSLIWALPVVAAIAAAWLAYTSFAGKGPTITISFQTATGLAAGKTRIKHNDIELGLVRSIEPTPDLSQVIVTAQMNATATEHLRSGTEFWLVRPRLSLTSFSGLETLVSGDYIEMDPGSGEAARKFTALEQPPVVRSGVQGSEYVLTTTRLGSIGAGSPVFFRGINVGEATSYTFEGIGKGIAVRIFVRAPYDALVYPGTRFWNDSGISLTSGAGGFKIQVDSLEAVLAGGIAFETPEAARRGQRSSAGTRFPLYDDRDAAQEAIFTRHARAIVEFDGSARGLEPGASVVLRGIRIGSVVDVQLVVDAAKNSVRVPVTVAIDWDRLGVVDADSQALGSGRLARQLVANGLRAQLRSANLLTGQLYVAFDFFPDAPPAEIDETGPYPRLPTVPSDMEGLTRSAEKLLDKLAGMPIDKVMIDLTNVLGSVERLVDAPEIMQSLRALKGTLVSAQLMMRDTQGQVGPLIRSLRRASEAADATIKRSDATLATMSAAYGRDSQVHADLVQLMRELTGTARSLRTLANYLEQHPESVIRGKAAKP